MSELESITFNLTWLPKKTFEVLAIVQWSKIAGAKETAIQKAKESVEINGFRKGKAPEKMVEAELGTQKLLEISLENLVPEIYEKAVLQLGLRPILSPKIELVANQENEPWQIKFTSCEEPEVKLGNYKDLLRGEKTAGRIWTPGKGDEKDKTEGKSQELRDEKLQKIIKWLIENIKLEMADLLIEHELNRKLANLLEQTQKLGLTIDQYLLSAGKTVDQVREEYRQQATQTLALEFIFNRIAEEEKLEVKPEEIEKMIASAKNDEEKKALENQKYFLASLARRQKTLDFLANL